MLARAQGHNFKFQRNRCLKIEEGTTCWQLEQMSHSYPPAPLSFLPFTPMPDNLLHWLPPFHSSVYNPCLTSVFVGQMQPCQWPNWATLSNVLLLQCTHGAQLFAQHVSTSS